jgi:hypothetical protein
VRPMVASSEWGTLPCVELDNRTIVPVLRLTLTESCVRLAFCATHGRGGKETGRPAPSTLTTVLAGRVRQGTTPPSVRWPLSSSAVTLTGAITYEVLKRRGVKAKRLQKAAEEERGGLVASRRRSKGFPLSRFGACATVSHPTQTYPERVNAATILRVVGIALAMVVRRDVETLRPERVARAPEAANHLVGQAQRASQYPTRAKTNTSRQVVNRAAMNVTSAWKSLLG